MTKRFAKYVGVEFSTSALTIFVRGKNGETGYVSIPMMGQTTVHGEPAFDHGYIPLLFVYALTHLSRGGWVFEGQEGVVVFAFRQHDLTLSQEFLKPLCHATSWMSNIATVEAAWLAKDDRVVAELGYEPAPRMLLPKAMWLFKQEPELRKQCEYLMTTGDWLVANLIRLPAQGRASELAAIADAVWLGTSDGRSNCLVSRSGQVAECAIRRSGIERSWIPGLAKSGHVVGTVHSAPSDSFPWALLRRVLAGWRVGAVLGDNHASGLGNGLGSSPVGSGEGTPVFACSAGSSGVPSTVIAHSVEIVGGFNQPGHPAPTRFEFFESADLLITLQPRCTLAYDDFRNRYLASDIRDDHEALNRMAAESDLSKLTLVKSDAEQEYYPPGWELLDVPEQVASMQFSVAAGLLSYTRGLLEAVPELTEKSAKCVLIAGLSQSAFFQSVFVAGMQVLAANCQVVRSAHEGPGKYQAGARGALLAAMLPDRGHDVASVAREAALTEPIEIEDANHLTKVKGRLLHALQDI